MEDSKVSSRSGINLAKILAWNVSHVSAVNFRKKGCFKLPAGSTVVHFFQLTPQIALLHIQEHPRFPRIRTREHLRLSWIVDLIGLPGCHLLGFWGLGSGTPNRELCVHSSVYCITQNVSRSGGSASTNLNTVRVQPPGVRTSPARGNFALKESRDSGRGVKFDSSLRLLFLRLRMAQEVLAWRILSPRPLSPLFPHNIYCVADDDPMPQLAKHRRGTAICIGISRWRCGSLQLAEARHTKLHRQTLIET